MTMTNTPTLEDLGIHMAAIVQPGDTVILIYRRTITREQALEAREFLEARVPEVKMVLVYADEMAIVRRDLVSTTEIPDEPLAEWERQLLAEQGRDQAARE
jgi:hypothetical protein